MFGLFEGGNIIGGAYKGGGGEWLRAFGILLVMSIFIFLVFWSSRQVIVGSIKLANRDYE